MPEKKADKIRQIKIVIPGCIASRLFFCTVVRVSFSYPEKAKCKYSKYKEQVAFRKTQFQGLVSSGNEAKNTGNKPYIFTDLVSHPHFL
jgi:hypothetical protein